MASLRYTTSKQYHFRPTGYYSPPLSAIIIVSALFIFIFGMYTVPNVFHFDVRLTTVPRSHAGVASLLLAHHDDGRQSASCH